MYSRKLVSLKYMAKVSCSLVTIGCYLSFDGAIRCARDG